jgi:hypothetical protein
MLASLNLVIFQKITTLLTKIFILSKNKKKIKSATSKLFCYILEKNNTAVVL